MNKNNYQIRDGYLRVIDKEGIIFEKYYKKATVTVSEVMGDLDVVVNEDTEKKEK